MTSSSSSWSSPERTCRDTAGATVLRISDAAALVAAVPSFIGFHPRDSLVLVATGGGSGRRVGLTLRIDLPPREHVGEVARAAVRGLMLDDPAGAAVIVVGGEGPSGCGPPHRDLVDLVARELASRQVDVHTVLWAESTAAGARWSCYDPCACCGVLPASTATPLAAAAVVNGQVVHADREALERLVAPGDPEALRRREVELVRRVDEALSTPGDADEAVTVSSGVATVDAALADAAADRLALDDDLVLALAGALAVPAVRDVALLRCTGRDAAAAEQLWTALVRETPDPEAAEPAALLAVSALLRGDGALANVALDRGERAWPGHRLTGILRAVAEAGLRPAEVRRCLQAEPATREPTPKGLTA